MEDINTQEDQTQDAATKDTSTETQQTESTESKTEDTEHIDYEAELEKVQNEEAEKKQSQYTELEKAQRALHFNAQRLKELGGDPADVLGVKPQEAKTDDPRSIVKEELDDRDALARANGNDGMYKLMKHYMGKGLSVDDAYVLANKGKILRSVGEAKRGNVQFAHAPNAQRITSEAVPQRSAEEVQLLARRGLHFDAKTKTYRGKFTEEYYDPQVGHWLSRKIR